MKNEFSAKRVQNGSLKLEPPFASFANSRKRNSRKKKRIKNTFSTRNKIKYEI